MLPGWESKPNMSRQCPPLRDTRNDRGPILSSPAKEKEREKEARPSSPLYTYLNCLLARALHQLTVLRRRKKRERSRTRERERERERMKDWNTQQAVEKARVKEGCLVTSLRVFSSLPHPSSLENNHDNIEQKEKNETKPCCLRQSHLTSRHNDIYYLHIYEYLWHLFLQK